MTTTQKKITFARASGLVAEVGAMLDALLPEINNLCAPVSSADPLVAKLLPKLTGRAVQARSKAAAYIDMTKLQADLRKHLISAAAQSEASLTSVAFAANIRAVALCDTILCARPDVTTLSASAAMAQGISKGSSALRVTGISEAFGETYEELKVELLRENRKLVQRLEALGNATLTVDVPVDLVPLLRL
jgi:hypothetical protein